MANSFAPNGFKFVRNYQSAAPTYQTTMAQIANNNANSFGSGDIVKLLATGFIDRALTSDTLFFGVLDWVEYYDTVQQKKIRMQAWLAPSTALAGSVFASVITDPQATYLVQSGNGGPVAQTNIGNNINFAQNAAPNTSTGISTAYADFATAAVTSTLPFRIVGIGYNNYYGQIGNSYDNTQANNFIEVIPNPGVWMATNSSGV